MYFVQRMAEISYVPLYGPEGPYAGLLETSKTLPLMATKVGFEESDPVN
jgi:hypothetical protein